MKDHQHRHSQEVPEEAEQSLQQHVCEDAALESMDIEAKWEKDNT